LPIIPAIAYARRYGRHAGESGGGSTQQRIVLSGVEEGGYTEVERKQDGKRFFARRRKQRGCVGEPTALVGEAGAEFVANAVSNPTVRPVLDLINIAQQNGSVKGIINYSNNPNNIGFLK
jgi:hypothetical protein